MRIIAVHRDLVEGGQTRNWKPGNNTLEKQIERRLAVTIGRVCSALASLRPENTWKTDLAAIERCRNFRKCGVKNLQDINEQPTQQNQDVKPFGGEMFDQYITRAIKIKLLKSAYKLLRWDPRYINLAQPLGEVPRNDFVNGTVEYQITELAKMIIERANTYDGDYGAGNGAGNGAGTGAGTGAGSAGVKLKTELETEL